MVAVPKRGAALQAEQRVSGSISVAVGVRGGKRKGVRGKRAGVITSRGQEDLSNKAGLDQPLPNLRCPEYHQTLRGVSNPVDLHCAESKAWSE